MTENGTFIINGTERVIVSQLHRSPGVFFSQPEKGLFAAQIIPYRGSWVEFEYDSKNLLHVRIDRKRKFLATVFLRALGLKTDAEILKTFYKWDRIQVREGKLYWKVSDNLLGLKLSKTIYGPKDASGRREELLHAGKKITAAVLPADAEARGGGDRDHRGRPRGRLHASPTSSTRARARSSWRPTRPLTPRVLVRDPGPREPGRRRSRCSSPSATRSGPMMSADRQEGHHQDARRGAHRDLPAHAAGRSADPRLLAQPLRGHVPEPAEVRLLAGRPAQAQHQARPLERRSPRRSCTSRTSPPSSRFLLKLRRNPAEVDDIDHLGQPPRAQRGRAAREPVPHRPRPHGARDQGKDERLPGDGHGHAPRPHQRQAGHGLHPRVLRVAASSASSWTRRTRSREITHKRRLSALGPGGLSRERAGFEVRDVHPTHYGRICPIETPEGPNIGLISSLSLLRPHQRVRLHREPVPQGEERRACSTTTRSLEAGRDATTRSATSSSATRSSGSNNARQGAQEEARPRSSRTASTSPPGKRTSTRSPRPTSSWTTTAHIVEDRVSARKTGNFVLAKREEVDYVDVSPKQLVSVAASLIPFLENDDANRALMGSNMQRQAVPLLRSEAPLVGTGMEHITVKDSGAAVVCRRAGRRRLRRLAAASSSASRPRTAPTRARRSAPTSTT